MKAGDPVELKHGPTARVILIRMPSTYDRWFGDPEVKVLVQRDDTKDVFWQPESCVKRI